MHKGVFVAFVALAAIFAAVPVARAQTGIPVVILDGRGFGHGVGLAQWGAKYLADAGANHEDIIAKFYPGTELSTAQGAGTVRVAVYTSPDNRSTLSFPYGGEVRSSPGGDQAPGFPVQVSPGGSVVVTYDGSYHVTPIVTTQSMGQPVLWEKPAANDSCIPLVNCPTDSTTTTTQPSDGCIVLCTPTTPPATTPPAETTTPSTAPPPSDPGAPPPPASGSATASSAAPVWAVPNGVTGVSERDRHYRGLLEATASGGPLRLVNQLDVETYLKGMGEVPSNWPLEAIAAQAVVARTYALRAMSFSGELCDYDLCQVYIGADREAASQNDAVDATSGQVVTYGGSLATTVYSADAGGITATPLEGFGSDTTYPYLQVVRYDTPDPLPWRSEVALSDVASRFAYPGTVTDVKIGQAGPSGRALQVTLDGSAGPLAVAGRDFASSLGLRSTLFQPTITTDDNVPPPPPFGAGGTQALPEDTAAIHRAALTGDTASLGGPNMAALRDWGSKLTSSLPRSAHRATDLAANPATWIVLTLVLMGVAFVFARGETPSPFAMQLVDGLRFPMLRWPAEGLNITSPLARPSPLESSSRPRRTRPLRVRRKKV